MNRLIVGIGLALMVGITLGGCGSTGDGTQKLEGSGELMELRSPAYDDGESIPERYTCDGRDQSPALSVDGVPDETETLVLIVEDPDASGGTFDHWLIWNVPANGERFPGGVPPDETVERLGDARQGKNGFGSLGYRGPCPPAGSIHRYVFTLYALDSGLELAPGANKQALIQVTWKATWSEPEN